MALNVSLNAEGLTVGRLTPALTGPIALVVAIALVIAILPLVISDIFILLQLTLFMAYAILAMSLGWVWGYGGIFSFGQAAFYGLGGYTYAVVSINMGGSTGALAAGVAVPAGAALLLGYLMFYGRISTVYVAVITLVVSLIFYKFLGHTAGYEYTIGTAHLGGFNGMPALPPINTPGNPDEHHLARGHVPHHRDLPAAGLCVPAPPDALQLRPRGRGGAGERDSGRAARLRHAALQDGDLRDRRCGRGPSRACSTPTGTPT